MIEAALQEKMWTWVNRGKEAIQNGIFMPTVAGYWPPDCIMAKKTEGACFCTSFKPPNKEELPNILSHLKMQLYYNNAQAYVYLSYMTIQGANTSTALGVFGATRSQKLFWVIPYIRPASKEGEISFQEPVSLPTSQAQGFSDLFIPEESLRPGMTELIDDLSKYLAQSEGEQRRSTALVDSFFLLRNQENVFPGVLPEEVMGLCQTYLDARKTPEETPNSSILTLCGGKG